MPSLTPRLAALSGATLAVSLLAASVVTAVPAAAAATGPKVPSSAACCDGRSSLRPGETISSDDEDNRTTITSVGLGSGPSDIGEPFTGFSLRVQPDGNLVEYELGNDGITRPVWASNTASSASPVRLTFQEDGNVVLYDSANTALWSTGTYGQPAAYFDVYGNGQVVTQTSTGQVLSASGPALTTLPGIAVSAGLSRDTATDGSGAEYEFYVQTDGNVVEYADAESGVRVLWQSGTAGAGRVQLFAQADGNLVLYSLTTGRAIWQSGTHGPTGYYQLDTQADGNVVLYLTDGVTRQAAVWATGTVQR